MIHPSFGEDFIRILAHGSKMRSTEFEVTAYSDGVTRWRIHLDPGSPLVSGGPSDQEAFSGVELQRNLYGAAWLGTEWTRSAIPDYQGALSYEVEVHNLKGKNLRTGPDGNARATLGFDVAPWKGASTFTDPTNFLDELKSLYYRFLRSGQAPNLKDIADRWFDQVAVEWKSILG